MAVAMRNRAHKCNNILLLSNIIVVLQPIHIVMIQPVVVSNFVPERPFDLLVEGLGCWRDGHNMVFE